MAERWWVERRTLEDGRLLFVTPLTFGRARLAIGNDDQTYEDGW